MPPNPALRQAALDGLWSRGSRGLPQLASHAGLDRRRFDEFLAERVDLDAGQTELDQRCAEDLLLAFACLERLPGAVDLFESLHGPLIAQHVASIDPRPEQRAELRQELLVRLLVPQVKGGRPKLADYSGRGPLRVWLKLAARRLALNQRRDQKRDESLSSTYGEHAAVRRTLDVELSFLRGQYEEPLRLAIRAAFGKLAPEERLVLRLHYREGLSSAGLALAMRVSKPTAHRRLASAREHLAACLRADLRHRLQLGPAAADELVDLLSTKMVAVLTAELRRGLDDAL